MFRYRTLLCTGLFLALTNVSMAQDRPAHSFTNKELKKAGWSEQQIAQLRDSYPQPKPAKSTGDAPPLKPKTKISYTSVFENYVAFDYLPNISWREANDKVGEIGGWRSYLKIVQDAAKLEADSKEGED